MKIVSLCGVYAIIHRPSGAAYVGSSHDIVRRWSVHLHRLSAGRHHARRLLDLWLLDGPTAFAFVVLQSCPRDVLAEREQEWLDIFGELLNTHRLTRVCPTLDPEIAARGGQSRIGRIVSEETRARLRAATAISWACGDHPRVQTVEIKHRISESLRCAYAEGRHTRSIHQETRAKISASLLGRVHHSEEIRKRISAGTRFALAQPDVKAKLGDARRASWVTRREQET